MASTLARDSDFFSIGTNDLTQYTLAVDRGNELVSTLYSAADPAVLRLIRTVIQDAYKAKIDVSVCGETASEPEYVMLLLGLVRTLSPLVIPEIKQVIRSSRSGRPSDAPVLAMNSEDKSQFCGPAEILPEAFAAHDDDSRHDSAAARLPRHEPGPRRVGSVSRARRFLSHTERGSVEAGLCPCGGALRYSEASARTRVVLPQR
jgi:phosphotransferase system enzyme I (PtsI)